MRVAGARVFVWFLVFAVAVTVLEIFCCVFVFLFVSEGGDFVWWGLVQGVLFPGSDLPPD